jgi:hypothetical protein
MHESTPVILVVIIIKILMLITCYACIFHFREERERERRQEIIAIAQQLQTGRLQPQPASGFYLGAPPPTVDVARTSQESLPPQYGAVAPTGANLLHATTDRPHHEAYNN